MRLWFFIIIFFIFFIHTLLPQLGFFSTGNVVRFPEESQSWFLPTLLSKSWFSSTGNSVRFFFFFFLLEESQLWRGRATLLTTNSYLVTMVFVQNLTLITSLLLSWAGLQLWGPELVVSCEELDAGSNTLRPQREGLKVTARCGIPTFGLSTTSHELWPLGHRQTDRQTDRQTHKPIRIILYSYVNKLKKGGSDHDQSVHAIIPCPNGPRILRCLCAVVLKKKKKKKTEKKDDSEALVRPSWNKELGPESPGGEDSRHIGNSINPPPKWALRDEEGSNGGITVNDNGQGSGHTRVLRWIPPKSNGQPIRSFNHSHKFK